MQLQDVLYFLLWAGMFFLMMRFGCGAHLMGHSHRPGAPERSSALPDHATDPVCGMNVQPAAAKTVAYLDRVYYFCSQTCREKFEAAPAAYTKSGNVAPLKKEHAHGCC